MTRRDRLANLFLFLGIVVMVAGLSQLGSLLVIRHLPENATLELSTLLHLTHVRNHGGVFGMLQGNGMVFAALSLALLTGVTAYLYRAPHLPRYEYVCFGFIVGGGASNILDRLLHGSVVDFIDIQHIPHWNYVFNTADVMIHVGIWPLLLLSLFPRHRVSA